jgi:hypothetical protein
MKEEESVVTCSDETRHNLTDEDYVTFREVEGMSELNGCQPVPVKVLGSITMEIQRIISDCLQVLTHSVLAILGDLGILSEVAWPYKLKFQRHLNL